MSASGEAVMCQVTFKRIAAEESRIYDAGGDHVGDVFAQDDVLDPGRRVYVVHLSEDPREFVRVYDRARIRQVAEERLRSHPFLP